MFLLFLLFLIVIALTIIGNQKKSQDQGMINNLYSLQFLKIFMICLLIISVLFFSALLYAYLNTDDEGKEAIVELLTQMTNPQETMNEIWSQQEN